MTGSGPGDLLESPELPLVGADDADARWLGV